MPSIVTQKWNGRETNLQHADRKSNALKATTHKPSRVSRPYPLHYHTTPHAMQHMVLYKCVFDST